LKLLYKKLPESEKRHRKLIRTWGVYTETTHHLPYAVSSIHNTGNQRQRKEIRAGRKFRALVSSVIRLPSLIITESAIIIASVILSLWQ